MDIAGFVARPLLLKAGAVVIGLLIAALLSQAWMLQLADERFESSQKDLALEKLASSSERAERERLARERIEVNRALDSLRATNKLEAERVQAQERLSNQRFAVLRTERDRLRNEVATFAAGGGEGGADSLAACHRRAATLGDLLVEGVQLQIEVAGAAETHAAAVRSLRASWPVNAP